MHNKKLIIKQRNEYIKKTKDDFTKLVEFPCPDWLTTDVYNNWMRTRDRVEFNLTTTFQSFLPGNEINKMTYNPAWNSNQLSCSPKFLSEQNNISGYELYEKPTISHEINESLVDFKNFLYVPIYSLLVIGEKIFKPGIL